MYNLKKSIYEIYLYTFKGQEVAIILSIESTATVVLDNVEQA